MFNVLESYSPMLEATVKPNNGYTTMNAEDIKLAFVTINYALKAQIDINDQLRKRVTELEKKARRRFWIW